MKNYTTKEQSERIMNVLMIPASTADFVYVKTIKGGHRISFPDDMEDGDYVEYPVWSLGRLFDIAFACIDVRCISIYRGENHIDDLMHFIEYSEAEHVFNYSNLYEIRK